MCGAEEFGYILAAEAYARSFDLAQRKAYVADGLPISSAPMESVVKQFNRRIKGTEKFWLKSGVEEVLQVRAAYLSEDDRANRFWAMPRPHYRAVGRNRLCFAA